MVVVVMNRIESGGGGGGDKESHYSFRLAWMPHASCDHFPDLKSIYPQRY